MSDESNVVVKKVRPYPILTTFEGIGGEKFVGNTVKLTLVGFLAELNETVVKVQDRYQCKLEIPVLHSVLDLQTRVIKTYDQFRKPTVPPVSPDGKPVEGGHSVAVRLAEFHFIDLEFLQKEQIKRFLIAIGQVPR